MAEWYCGNRPGFSIQRKTDISFDELDIIVKKIKNRLEFGFTELYAKDETEEEFGIYASMSPEKKVRKVKISREYDEESLDRHIQDFNEVMQDTGVSKTIPIELQNIIPKDRYKRDSKVRKAFLHSLLQHSDQNIRLKAQSNKARI
jgi:hypothetical protein